MVAELPKRQAGAHEDESRAGMAAKTPAAPAASATGAAVSFLAALATGLALRLGFGTVARCQGTGRTG
jgi:hypothetical protein